MGYRLSHAEIIFARTELLQDYKKGELASGEVATPKSPIPPARASGEILKKGTAVVTTLIVILRIQEIYPCY